MDKNIDLVSLPKKSFWKLSIPIIAFCIFDAIYGIVDMLWVSQISVEAFFALGVSIPLVSLIFSFGDSLGQGTNSLMSRFLGNGDYESAYNTLIHGMILSNLIWGMIVATLLLGHRILFYLDKVDSYILVFEYLVPLVIFAYIFIFVNLFSETLQAEGNSRLPSFLIIFANILNMILDPIFIFNLNLGIQGAAYATVLSAFIAFIILIFYYVSGRSKIPLSLKYFKLRPYIFAEIIKVALPNILDNALWFISASFLNSMLIITMGQMGPILYSVSNKIKSLLMAPIKGYGRGLMSVTGHLFGAHKFDDLNGMFKYVLKVSLITTFIEMMVFIVIRDYVFGWFSITMQNEIFWIAVGGTFIMLAVPFSVISSKMLDGFGKSLYSLMFTAIKIVSEMALIYGLFIHLGDGRSILIGLVLNEIIIAMVYYLFLRHLFNNFDVEYSNKETVESVNKDSSSIDSGTEDVEKSNVHKALLKIPLILALIGLIILFIRIVYLPIKTMNYSILLFGTISFIIGALSIYMMERLNKPKLSILGFFINAIVIFVFLGESDYYSTVLFIMAGITLIYIKLIIGLLYKMKDVSLNLLRKI